MHHTVDDAPFGGGPGMVMKPDVLARAVDEALGIASDLAEANPGGAYEIRPVSMFWPGSGSAGPIS